MVGKYKVITLCGSTRFKDEFLEAQKRLTLEGNIVISVGLFGHSGDKEVWENMDEGTITKTKEMLDDMHKRKIDMADEIYVINVDGYIGASTMSEIEYAKAAGKTVKYLEDPESCYIPAINLDNAFSTLNRRRKDICKYEELMGLSGSPDDPVFQKKYCGFYRVRRDAKWRSEYFHLMASFQNRGDASFGEILLRLFQATGRIESSFTNKMLATLAPDMPIWDSKVLKALHLQLKGSTPELRISNAVILYDRICHWYKLFLNTEQAVNMIEQFDREFPEFASFTATKKIDFVLWASQ